MNFGRLADRAKQLVGRRGGTESLKEDAQELRDIARGEGSLSDKAKEAVEAVKEPGAKPDEPGRPGAGEPGAKPDEPGQPGAAPEPERRDQGEPGPR